MERGGAKQDLVWRRNLLEAGGGIGGVARRERLARRWVADDNLSGIDPGPYRDLKAPIAFELDVELCEGGSHLERSPDRSKSVVLVRVGDTESCEYSVADE